MTTNPILVNNQPFFGRIEEQRQFRAALNDVVQSSESDMLPYIFLLYGDGGIGKSTLIQRFKDIVGHEFSEQFQILFIDWEEQRGRSESLRVGREYVGAEAIFDILYKEACYRGWRNVFKSYEEATIVRREAMEKVARVLDALAKEDDREPELSQLHPGLVVDILRVSLENVDKQLANLFAKIGVKATVDRAMRLRNSLENRLRSELGWYNFNLVVNPHEELARTLAICLKVVAHSKPLILFFDTYEIVDRADQWLRIVIREAGPDIIWVIAGRNDLVNDREYGLQFFKGYASDFSYHLLTFDMRRLAEEDVHNYFNARIPHRSVTSKDLSALSRATRGIPLAIRQAADLWAKNLSIDSIVGDTTDRTPHHQIVHGMTSRYFLHCIANDDDRQALYALALARGNDKVLRAMLYQNTSNTSLVNYEVEIIKESVSRQELLDFLVAHFNQDELNDLIFDLDINNEQFSSQGKRSFARSVIEYCERHSRYSELVKRCQDLRRNIPLTSKNLLNFNDAKDIDNGSFELDTYLRRLERDYASVYREEARLHDEPAAFLRGDLRTPLRRNEPWVRALNQRAVNALYSAHLDIESNLPSLKGRCEDKDWTKVVLDLAEFLFWLDEKQAWRWIIPRFIEGMAYNSNIGPSLLEIVGEWEGWLSSQGKQLLIILRGNDRSIHNSHWQASDSLFKELMRLADQGWLAGPGEAERRAILCLQWGQLCYGRDLHADTRRLYEQAEQFLPQENETLRRQLMDAWRELGNELWRSDKAVDAINALEHAIKLEGNDPLAWHYLSHAYFIRGYITSAILATEQSIINDTEEHFFWRCVDEMFGRDSYHYDPDSSDNQEETNHICQQIALRYPTNAAVLRFVTLVYRGLGRYDEAISSARQAVTLEPGERTYWQILIELLLKKGLPEEAIATYTNLPQSPEVGELIYSKIGTYYEEIQNYNEAINLYKRVFFLNDNFGNMYKLHGLLIRIGRNDEALEFIENTRFTNFSDEDTALLLDVLDTGRHYTELTKVIKEIIGKNLHTRIIYEWLGYAYHDLHLLREDIEQYRQKNIHSGAELWYAGWLDEAVKEFTKTNGRHDRGQVYAELGEYKQAVLDLDMVISIRDHAYPRNGRALAYAGLRQFERSLSEFEISVKMAPNNAWVYYNRALAYEWMGQIDKAIDDYKTSLKMTIPALNVLKRKRAEARLRILDRPSETLSEG